MNPSLFLTLKKFDYSPHNYFLSALFYSGPRGKTVIRELLI